MDRPHPPPAPASASSAASGPLHSSSSLSSSSSPPRPDAGARPSTLPPSASSLPPAPPPPPPTTAAPTDATAAHLDAAAAALQALPRDARDVPLDADDAAAAYTFRHHVRAPTATGLHLQTSNLFPADPQPPHDANANLEGPAGDLLRHSATAPIAIHDGHLRSALGASSMTESLSPGSALSSPLLNALTDLTPLPSPLMMGDSPNPFSRHGSLRRPRSRGLSNASAKSFKDDSFAMFAKGTLSPSPSLKKKSYQRLHTPAADAPAAGSQSQPQNSNEPHHSSKRAVSDFTPEQIHNIRERHVSISNVAPVQIESAASAPQLHREAYLAAQRGLVSTTHPVGLPTPPASNASNASIRSVTESEGEDVAEDDKVNYITVRHGPHRIRKNWRPIRELGRGTFSKVFLATSEKIRARDPLDESALDPHKLVAIKVVEHGPAGGADEDRVQLSLKREVEMLRAVSHPSLVHLKEFDAGEAQALIVLTYCPGGDLFEVASAHKDVLGIDIVQRVFAELVSAVRYLHDKLIVHRDIKLENVLLNIPISAVPLLKDPQAHQFPLATLTDLGLSRRIPAPPESPLLTTRCGSEDYAAPEILLGQPYDGRATDAWALGVLLYALMEGRLPFDPPPGKANSRSRAAHRIARCDWSWWKFGDEDGEWDATKGEEWAGAREVVEALLKKASRGRKGLAEIAEMDWVKGGITVPGGVERRIEDSEDEGFEAIPESVEEKEAGKVVVSEVPGMELGLGSGAAVCGCA